MRQQARIRCDLHAVGEFAFPCIAYHTWKIPIHQRLAIAPHSQNFCSSVPMYCIKFLKLCGNLAEHVIRHHLWVLDGVRNRVVAVDALEVAEIAHGDADRERHGNRHDLPERGTVLIAPRPNLRLIVCISHLPSPPAADTAVPPLSARSAGSCPLPAQTQRRGDRGSSRRKRSTDGSSALHAVPFAIPLRFYLPSDRPSHTVRRGCP